jgi:hypothetical protein
LLGSNLSECCACSYGKTDQGNKAHGVSFHAA